MVTKDFTKFDFLQLINSVVNKDIEKAIKIVKEGIEKGIQPEELITKGLQPAMVIVGDKFSNGEYFIPDMLLSSRVAQKALEYLEPHLIAGGLPTIGRVVIGTVLNDIHDIGKNLVAKFLRGVGFDVIDLGTNVSTDSFVKGVKKHNPDIVGISALLTTTMIEMENVIIALEKENLRSTVKIIVGGAPITQQFADQINADAYCPDSASAAELCRKWLTKLN
jgi:5-methyltetrahydrofolate--homocysteine methyltransferase